MIYINRTDLNGKIKTVGNAKTEEKANKLLSEFEYNDRTNDYSLSETYYK